jgi:pyruvate-formate lyase-activating enzyme
LEANLHPRWNLPDGSTRDEIYAQWQETDPPEMQLIEEVVVVADVAVSDVPTIEMTSRQLGDIAYSYGEATLGGKRALVVLTADERGGLITIRPQRNPCH